ncbi:Uncharacterised protein [Candidatus Burarchaeum australiense]|nr:Uncharacterised protein [Candidatus Burarchaeum australiense]
MFCILLGALFVCGCAQIPGGGGVFVNTERVTYAGSDQVVNITVFNNRSAPIYYVSECGGTYDLYRFGKGGEWYRQSRGPCYTIMTYPPPGPTIVEIGAGKSAWIGMEDVGAGTKYKISFDYYTDALLAYARMGAQTAFSEEFELIATPPIREGIFVSVDKNQYAKGDVVRISILNNRTETIQYLSGYSPDVWMRAGAGWSGCQLLNGSPCITEGVVTASYAFLEPGKSAVFEWNQTQRIAGTYVIRFDFDSMASGMQGYAYSEDFELE